MSSSSRSIAAARQKRAGEQSQQMNTSRPVTSISSQGAFAQQYQQQMMSKSIPISSKNVRTAQNINKGTGGRNNTNIIQNNQSDQSTKISISNAVGLITLRLGRLESIINESIENGFLNNDNNDNNDNTNTTPHNMKLVSDEVFENIVNRINLLESKVIQFTNQHDKLEQLENEMKNMQSSLDNLNTILSSFVNDTNEKFMDYENALAEIEKNFEVEPELNNTLVKEESASSDLANINEETLEKPEISSETQENNDKDNNE
jgi:hypothetical protein